MTELCGGHGISRKTGYKWGAFCDRGCGWLEGSVESTRRPTKPWGNALPPSCMNPRHGPTLIEYLKSSNQATMKCGGFDGMVASNSRSKVLPMSPVVQSPKGGLRKPWKVRRMGKALHVRGSGAHSQRRISCTRPASLIAGLLAFPRPKTRRIQLMANLAT